MSTDLSQKNLISEGIDKSLVTVTGNTVVDALYWVLNKIEKSKKERTLEIYLINIYPLIGKEIILF